RARVFFRGGRLRGRRFGGLLLTAHRRQHEHAGRGPESWTHVSQAPLPLGKSGAPLGASRLKGQSIRVPRALPETPDLDVLRAAFRDFIPHNKALGMELVTATFNPAVAVLSLPFKPELVGNPETGHVHGGVITTLIDATGGAAVFLALKEPMPI